MTQSESKTMYCKCPLCGRTMARCTMGVNSHLRTHVRSGEITMQQKYVMRTKLTGGRL